jgi:hypothetical protein
VRGSIIFALLRADVDLFCIFPILFSLRNQDPVPPAPIGPTLSTSTPQGNFLQKRLLGAEESL